MCQRSRSQNPTTTLRRSPRFLQQDQSNPDDDPKTPKLDQRRMQVSSDLTPLSSIQEGYLNKSQKQRSGKNSEKAPETHVKPVISTKLTAQQRRSTKYGLSKDSRFLRRSPRFFEGCNVKDNGNEESKDLSKTESVSEFPSKSDSGISRRVTRSFSRANKKEAVTGSVNRVIGSLAGEVENVLSKLDKEWVKSGANLSEQCLYKIEKRVTRSSSRGAELADIQKCGNEKGGRSIQLDSFECLDKGVLSHKGNGEVDNKLSKQCMREPVSRRKCNTSLPADPAEEGDRKGFDNEEEQDLVGMKKKRAEADQGHRVIQGWTREQEVALQRAYFAANPTPHFWKKVSKMVPGKSAQDCFDKIHSDHLTPPQHQPRSRAKRINSSSLSFSASKLLTSSEPKGKKMRNSKQKNSLSHKAVRELLQKQCKIDQDNEADLFTVLEPTLDPSIRTIPGGPLFSTPECNKIGPGYLKSYMERSSSARRKQLSRFNTSSGATLTSPPVLKQVKNKALHDKYIDQLHTREAKRKAASVRATKCIQNKHDAVPNGIQRSEVVKAAKDALIFEAREAIHQLHHLENCMTNNDDFCDDFADITEDDIEEGS